MAKTKPPKRKEPTPSQIKQWLKDHGHSTTNADKINSTNDVLKLHERKII